MIVIDLKGSIINIEKFKEEEKNKVELVLDHLEEDMSVIQKTVDEMDYYFSTHNHYALKDGDFCNYDECKEKLNTSIEKKFNDFMEVINFYNF